MTKTKHLRSSTPAAAIAQASPNPPDPVTIESVLGLDPKAARLLGRDVSWQLLVGVMKS